jgi:hypothetical protein
MITALQQMLPEITAWPLEDQQALAEAARAIKAERLGVYYASASELAAINCGLDDANHDRFSTDDEVAMARAKFRSEIR